jgi:hypothetical protein
LNDVDAGIPNPTGEGFRNCHCQKQPQLAKCGPVDLGLNQFIAFGGRQNLMKKHFLVT